MADNDVLAQLRGYTPEEQRYLNQALNLAQKLNRPVEDARKSLEKQQRDLEAARKAGADNLVEFIISQYKNNLNDIDARATAKTYEQGLENLGKLRERYNDELRKLEDPLRPGDRLFTAAARIRADPGAFREFMQSAITDPQGALTRLDITTGGFPELIFAAAGIEGDELQSLSDSLFEQDEFADMYDSWDDVPEFIEQVENAADDEVESTWSRVERGLSEIAGLSPKEMQQVRDLYRTSLLERAQTRVASQVLRDKLADINEDEQMLTAAQQREVPYEQAAQHALEKAFIAAGPLEGVFFPTKEQAVKERQRPWSQEDPEGFAAATQHMDPQMVARLGQMDPAAAQETLGLLNAQRSSLNPLTAAMLDYTRRVGAAPKDPAFQQWRMARGIPVDQPVSVGEYNRYQRQVRRVGRDQFRAKKTGALREIEYADKSFAIDAGPMGDIFFSDKDGNYLKADEVEAQAQRDLQQANVVEFRLSGNNDALVRVGNAITSAGGREIGEFLQTLVGKPAAERVRMRVLFDRKTGEIVVLDKDRKVALPKQAITDGEALTMLQRLATDPDMANVVGSAPDLGKAKPGNRLENLKGAKEGEQMDVGFYVPEGLTLRTEPPTTTIVGEVVNVPGSDPRFAYVMQEVDGKRRIEKVPLSDILKQRGFKDINAFAEAVGQSVRDPAVARQWGRVERKAKRAERVKGRAAKRAPLGSKSTARGAEFAPAPALEPREKPEGEKPKQTPESQALGGDNPDQVATPRIAPRDLGESPVDYATALDAKRLGTSEQDMSIESPVSPDEKGANPWAYTQLPHFGGRPEDNRLYPQASLSERLAEAWRGNFPDEKDKKKPKAQ